MENDHNSKSCHDINMKLGPVTKSDKTSASMSKQFVYDVMPENRDVIVFFLIYGKIVAIRKLDFGRMVY